MTDAPTGNPGDSRPLGSGVPPRRVVDATSTSGSTIQPRMRGSTTRWRRCSGTSCHRIFSRSWRWRAEDIHPYLDVALECFGPGRLVAGSDWPVCTVAADYSRTMRLIADYVERHAPADREAVLGGNAKRFYGLSRRGTSGSCA